jgi:hypothetical protein
VSRVSIGTRIEQPMHGRLVGYSLCYKAIPTVIAHLNRLAGTDEPYNSAFEDLEEGTGHGAPRLVSTALHKILLLMYTKLTLENKNHRYLGK